MQVTPLWFMISVLSSLGAGKGIRALESPLVESGRKLEKKHSHEAPIFQVSPFVSMTCTHVSL
jgi:hypothetical protein